MDKYTVERIRISYASGVYNKYNLWDSYKHVVNPIELSEIIDYAVYPEIRKDLKETIRQIEGSIKLYNEYQGNLRAATVACQEAERRGVQYPYENTKAQLEGILTSKLEGFPLVDKSILAKSLE